MRSSSSSSEEEEEEEAESDSQSMEEGMSAGAGEDCQRIKYASCGEERTKRGKSNSTLASHARRHSSEKDNLCRRFG